jgi:hypothetical protein
VDALGLADGLQQEPPDGEKMQHGATTMWILRFLLRARGF